MAKYNQEIKIKTLLLDMKRELTAVCGYEALHEARLMLSCAMGTDVSELLIKSLRGECVDGDALLRVRGMLSRRMLGEPLQYILGSWDFYNLTFKVDRCALIPRSDTECIVERALGLCFEHGYGTALDMCCGSGCIGVALAKNSKLAVDFADISPDALALTRENAALHGVKNSEFILSDMFSGIKKRYELIIINPPYLSAADMACLQSELRFEPVGALFGGDDGLSFYRRIHDEFSRALLPGGALVLEIGASQFDSVSRMFGDEHCSVEKLIDCAGLDRGIVVKIG